MDQERENEIIGLILKGDCDSYALLVDKYKGPIFNLAVRMIGNYQDADDAAQETFIRAYESLKAFDIKKRFFPWLYTIGLNIIRSRLKKKKPVLTENFDIGPQGQRRDDRGSPEQALFKQQERSKLAFCLQKLPLELREPIVLRFYQDLPFEAISEILDISLSAAKMRVYRGLEKLRLSMKG